MKLFGCLFHENRSHVAGDEIDPVELGSVTCTVTPPSDGDEGHAHSEGLMREALSAAHEGLLTPNYKPPKDYEVERQRTPSGSIR